MFSVIASTIFVVFGISIYVFSSLHRKNDFRERLRKRVVVTEKMFLEKETFSPEEFEKITNQFLHTLPHETEEVVEIINGKSLTFSYSYPDWVRDQLLVENVFEFEQFPLAGLGRRFEVHGKSYLIIVTAIDQDGHQNLSFLKYRIIFLILIGIPVIFLSSFIMTTRALSRLSKKLDHVRAITANNLDQRLNVKNAKDEIGKLGVSFNKLLDRLEASFEAQKSFISNASHEIKNPLTAILGEAEIAISKTRTTEEYVEALQKILIEAEGMNLTVNNLLQLSKVTASEGQLNLEVFDFRPFLHQIRESFDFMNPENQINLQLPPGSEPYFISGSKSLLKSAILNVFDNACKFSGNQPVQVTLGRGKGQVILEIQDAGIGIAEKDLKNVTDPFFRGSNAMKINGSGIGLALSAKIVELHEGRLEVTSEIRKGTLVLFNFPPSSA